MRKYSGALITAIGNLPGLTDAKKSYEEGVKGFDEATWSPDNKALKAVTDTNRTISKRRKTVEVCLSSLGARWS